MILFSRLMFGLGLTMWGAGIALLLISWGDLIKQPVIVAFPQIIAIVMISSFGMLVTTVAAAGLAVQGRADAILKYLIAKNAPLVAVQTPIALNSIPEQYPVRREPVIDGNRNG